MNIEIDKSLNIRNTSTFLIDHLIFSWFYDIISSKNKSHFGNKLWLGFNYQKVNHACRAQTLWLLNHIWNNMMVSIKCKYQWKWVVGVSLVFVVSLLPFYQRHMFNHLLQIHDHIVTVSEHSVQDHNWNMLLFKNSPLEQFNLYFNLKVQYFD